MTKQVEVKRAVPKEESVPSHGYGAQGYGAQSHGNRDQNAGGQRTKKVFLGGISPDTTKDDVAAAFSDYQIDYDNIEILKHKDTDKPRGFGFIIFGDFETAEDVCRKKYFTIRVICIV